MRVLIAPDKFKGSVSATAVAGAGRPRRRAVFGRVENRTISIREH